MSPAPGSTAPAATPDPGRPPATAPEDPSIRVRPARPGEVATTADVHRRALPSGFFARLGTAFLARYHTTFAVSARARLLVAERGGEVVGFLAGTIDNAEHYRTVLRHHPARLALTGLRALVRHPGLAAEFVRTRIGRYGRAVLRQLGRRTSRPAAGSPPGDGGRAEPVAVLTHVAVDERLRGSGAGRALVDAFVAEVGREGEREVRLVTATDGAGPRFYRRLGWRSRGIRAGADGTVVEEFAHRP